VEWFAVKPKRSVLVTGSSGFVGGCVSHRLRTAGWDALGIGRRLLHADNYLRHDLIHPLSTAINRSFEVVVHAAARSSPWGRWKDFDRNNVEATRLLLDYCRNHGTPRFVYISSSSVLYRPGHQLQMTEDTPLAEKPANAYAATKQQAEMLVKEYPGAWVILRPRAVFGPGDTVLFPRILAAAQAGRLPLLVPDGPPVMGDLMFIDNLIDCVVRAAELPTISGVFNLTNGEPVPLIAFLLDILARLAIPAPRRRISVRKAMAVAALLEGFYSLFLPRVEPPITRFGVHVFAYSKTFDVSKMIDCFGPPRVSLAEGVDRFVAWVKNERPYDRPVSP
jgi:2-alkyl-3-oxoalkanoate reductase